MVGNCSSFSRHQIQLTKQNVATQVCEITKSVAEIVNLTSAAEPDQKLVDKEISAL